MTEGRCSAGDRLGCREPVVQGGRTGVRAGTNSLGRPDPEWRDLPTSMPDEHESCAAEFVLDARVVECLPDQKIAGSRRRFPWS